MKKNTNGDLKFFTLFLKMDKVESFWKLFERIEEQIKEKQRDIVMITDFENYMIDCKNSFKVLTNAALNIPEPFGIGVLDYLKTVNPFVKHVNTITLYRQQYMQKRFPVKRQIDEIEQEFPLDRTFQLRIDVYYDDVRFVYNHQLPGFSFRVRQALASWGQQIEMRCCLNDPSDKFRNYPHHMLAELKFQSRHPYDCFFDEEMTGMEMCMHYVETYIEELNHLGPHMFVPHMLLPLMIPTDLERAHALIHGKKLGLL